MPIEEKETNGQFVKGTSGNPSGRPPGSRNKTTLMMEGLLEGEAEQLFRKAVELALGGDVQALRLCLERLMPPRKDRLVHFDIPPVDNLNDIALALKHILGAISEGQITPQEGEILSRIVDMQANLIAAQDLKERVEKLEEGQSREPDRVTVLKNYR
jgi:hypothetical protein